MTRKPIIPDLEPHCGSWIIMRRDTGAAAFETFDRAIAESVGADKCEVFTTTQWLGRLNRLDPNRRGPWQRPAVCV